MVRRPVAIDKVPTMLVVLVLGALVSVLAVPARAGASGLVQDGRSFDEVCADLGESGGPKLPHRARISSSELLDATEPPVCSVRGAIEVWPESTINWEVELPHPAAWNGKSVTIGGGAFDGFIPTDSARSHSMLGPTGDNYVKMSSDSGHQVRGFFPWALDQQALINHGYRANHLTLETGTRLSEAFYGAAPSRRYMIGHSNGGRSGVVAAQRYPHDYDGIVALEPAISQQAHEAFLPQTLQHIFSDPENHLDQDDIALFAEAETAACDGLDGLEDGMIGNVEACDYMGTDLACQAGETDGCLTDGQLESIERLYSDIAGYQLPDELTPGYPRFGRGGGATSDWWSYIFRSFENPSSFNYFADSEGAKVVTGDPDATAFDITDPSEYEEEFRRLSKVLDPTQHNLTPFAKSGGKLLVWYGVSDTCVSIYRTAEYFESLKETMGEEMVDRFARLYASPGVGHNRDGPGAETVDLLSAVDAWVENEQLPDDMVASKYAGGYMAHHTELLLQRPVCEWPKYPRYVGGDPTEASSFDCAAPGAA